MTPVPSATPVTSRNGVRHRTARRLVSVATGALLMAMALGLAAGPAAPAVRASCASPAPILDAMNRADVVLVGTVTGVENDGRWATVTVEERWKAQGSVPDQITVRGGPEPGTDTSIDQVYGKARYLFFLTIGRDYFLDNACTGTTAWTWDLAQFRPVSVQPAPDVVAGVPLGSRDGIDIVPVAALLALLVIALVAYVLTLRARRRPPDWVR